MNSLRLMIVATEPSGDRLGGDLAAALYGRLEGHVSFVGVGGPWMAAQGIVSPFDPWSLALLGVFNAIGAYPTVLRRVRQTVDLAARERPVAAILIDAWGFNLRVAQGLRRLDPKIILIKYVAPQVWATRPGRARTLAGAVDHLLTIHAFDAPLFESVGLPSTFVGNPALGRNFDNADAEALVLRAAIGATPEEPMVLVLPGSRGTEIARLAKPFGDAVALLKAARPKLKVVVAAADAVREPVKRMVADWICEVYLVEGEAARLGAMRAATAALACSGTVTTELALAGCPMVVAYRLGAFTHLVAKLLIRTRYITLINVAAGAFVAPERVQNGCTGKTLARDIARLLDDPAHRNRQITAQNSALEIMRGGQADPLAAAADAVIDILRRRGAV